MSTSRSSRKKLGAAPPKTCPPGSTDTRASRCANSAAQASVPSLERSMLSTTCTATACCWLRMEASCVGKYSMPLKAANRTSTRGG